MKQHTCVFKTGIAIDPKQRYSCWERGMGVPIQKDITLMQCEKCAVCGKSRYLNEYETLELKYER